jgi:RNA polymerase sigma-70 factor (ECF subfamily)
MSSDSRFRELMRRFRAGEQQAATELYEKYGEQIRRVIRVKMTNPVLRTLYESGDIFQSVFFKFHVKAMLGLYDLNEPTDLIKLLTTMAKNKIKDKARRENRRPNTNGEVHLPNVPDQGERPSQVLAEKELMDKIRASLSESERRVAGLRTNGGSWQEIADECGGTPEGLRKLQERAVERVCQEFGITEDGDG